MNLPPLPIPELPAEFMPPIPELVHPFVVHFAIALPFVILLIELINLFTRKRALGVMSFVFMVILTLILYAALLTGGADAQAAKDTIDAGTKALLTEHKEWAIYLFYASVVLMLFKLLSVLVRKTPLKILFLVILIFFAAGTLATGKRGGELVFGHGVNVQSAKKSGQSVAPATAPAAEMKKEESAAPAEAKAPESAPEATQEPTPAAEQAPKAEAATPPAPSASESAAAEMKEQAAEAAETVKEEAGKMKESAEEMAGKAEQKGEEAAAAATEPAAETPAPAAPAAPAQ